MSAAFKAPLAATLLIIEEISSHFSKTHATHVVVACIFAFHMARRPATTPPPRPPPPPASATRQHTSTAHLHRCLQRLYLHPHLCLSLHPRHRCSPPHRGTPPPLLRPAGGDAQHGHGRVLPPHLRAGEPLRSLLGLPHRRAATTLLALGYTPPLPSPRRSTLLVASLTVLDSLPTACSCSSTPSALAPPPPHPRCCPPPQASC